MSDDTAHDFRRLIYRSVPTQGEGGDDLREILSEARLNNGLEGVSGLLLAGEFNYFQILEGSPESVDFIFARIRSDKRHFAVNVLSDERCGQRVFGDWTMASLRDDDAEIVRDRMDQFRAVASDQVREAMQAALNGPQVKQ